MLIFASDLHLADDKRRASFDADAFLSALDNFIRDCRYRESEPASLVLLGDIFELLKSDLWFDDPPTRPWDNPEPNLSARTCQILQRIADSNKDFFDGLKSLHSATGMRLIYLPGNHDGLLGDSAGGDARALLRRLLPLGSTGNAPFKTPFVAIEHGVVAEHGHTFDNLNSPTASTGRFIPGDAVVIELLAQLPKKMADVLETDQFDPRLEFIHELDNVLPQNAEGLVNWVDHQLQLTSGTERQQMEKALRSALSACIEGIRTVARKNRAIGLTDRAMTKPLASYVRYLRFPFLRIFKRLPAPIGDELTHVAMRVGAIASAPAGGGEEFDLFVSGHTHYPRQHPVVIAPNRVVTYLNTGTWRRVHRQVGTSRTRSFHTYNEETLLCVYQRGSTAGVRYDFRRHVRGF